MPLNTYTALYGLPDGRQGIRDIIAGDIGIAEIVARDDNPDGYKFIKITKINGEQKLSEART